MSGALGALVPSKYDSSNMVSFIAANGTTAKILVDKTAPAVLTANSPQFYGGVSVFDIVASSSDIADKDLKLYVGTIKTTQDPTNTGALTTTTSSLARALGSWITDGWTIGDQAMVFAPSTVASNAEVDGIMCTVTGVTGTTLTFNGTPLAALTLAALSRIVKVSLICATKVQLGAGSVNGNASVPLLGNTNSGSIVTNERKLGLSDLLIVAPAAAVSALPCAITVNAQTAYY